MTDTNRDVMVKRWAEEIKFESDDESVRALSDETLERIGESYLEKVEAIETEANESLRTLLSDEEAPDVDIRSLLHDLETGAEIDDEGTRDSGEL